MRAIWFAIPLVVGTSQPVLWAMNIRMARSTGVMEAAVVLHAVGTLVGATWIAVASRGAGFAGLGTVPWWAFLAGAIGITGMAAANRAMPEIGVSSALALVVAGQFCTSLVVENWGLLDTAVRAATPSRWLGALLLAAGAWLVSRT